MHRQNDMQKVIELLSKSRISKNILLVDDLNEFFLATHMRKCKSLIEDLPTREERFTFSHSPFLRYPKHRTFNIIHNIVVYLCIL